MILKYRLLPLTGKHEYTFSNPVGRCFSASKVQSYMKSNLIKVYNRNFTEEEYEAGTDVGFKERNGISITKDVVIIVVDEELKNNEKNWIENALIYIKNNLEMFID